MDEPLQEEITTLIHRVRNGRRDQLERLLGLVLPSLRHLAASALANEKPGHTLQPTGPVNEAVIRLFLRERAVEMDPRAAQIFELRYFGGMQRKEIASSLGITGRTVQRDWDAARAWLQTTLRRHG